MAGKRRRVQETSAENGDSEDLIASRPALLEVDHPLNFTRAATFKEFRGLSTSEQLVFLLERRQIEDLLNQYAYILDTCLVRHEAVDEWADLFTDDCELTFPFGTHQSKKGLAEWCLDAESRFKRMAHMSSNFTIKFESETVAHGRSLLMATCGLHEKDLGHCFFEGGYYYWSFLKVNGLWKISYLFLDVIWTKGESLGLNDQRS